MFPLPAGGYVHGSGSTVTITDTPPMASPATECTRVTMGWPYGSSFRARSAVGTPTRYPADRSAEPRSRCLWADNQVYQGLYTAHCHLAPHSSVYRSSSHRLPPFWLNVLNQK